MLRGWGCVSWLPWKQEGAENQLIPNMGGKATPKEDHQTRVFPEGLIIRADRRRAHRAITEPAPHQPGSVWGESTGPRGEENQFTGGLEAFSPANGNTAHFWEHWDELNP